MSGRRKSGPTLPGALAAALIALFLLCVSNDWLGARGLVDGASQRFGEYVAGSLKAAMPTPTTAPSPAR